MRARLCDGASGLPSVRSLHAHLQMTHVIFVVQSTLQAVRSDLLCSMLLAFITCSRVLAAQSVPTVRSAGTAAKKEVASLGKRQNLEKCIYRPRRVDPRQA